MVSKFLGKLVEFDQCRLKNIETLWFLRFLGKVGRNWPMLTQKIFKQLGLETDQ